MEDNAGNITIQGILMADELNMHFSSVPETKFNGTEGERLERLVVTPEVVASKITNMKNISHQELMG